MSSEQKFKILLSKLNSKVAKNLQSIETEILELEQQLLAGKLMQDQL